MGGERSGCGPEGRKFDSSQAHKRVSIAQWIERVVPVHKAVGPIPTGDTNFVQLTSLLPISTKYAKMLTLL